MKAFFFICLAVLLAVPLIRSDPVGECPPDNPEVDVLLPDSEDCSIFYKCNYGVPVLQECPGGLLFNPEQQYCDYPQNVDC